MKFFNTAGPVNMDNHYKLDPLHRWDLDEIMTLIEQQKYFILHAPRQTGKTSTLLALQDYLNAKGEYIAIYINVEAAQVARNDVNEGIRTILNSLKNKILNTNIKYKNEINIIYKDIFEEGSFKNAFNEFLQKLSMLFEKPIVLLIDEIDSLIGDTLISVLRQLRSGYNDRPSTFPQSIILCGLVDIKDYKIHSSDGEIITGGSCFNIKAEALCLVNFTKEDIKKLYLEHTQETGQMFENQIFDLAWEYTAGQPWLVNALAYELTYTMKENRNRSVILSAEMFEQAKERLIQSRATHLDQLADKLKEERVYNLIRPMIMGLDSKASSDDEQYCLDLGLISKTKQGLVVSNDIYKEVLPRELTNTIQNRFLSTFTPDWINPNKSINTEKLMTMFQQFWRENSDIWSANIAGYTEAAAHLVFQGFLQRVSNGNGLIEREYGFGRKRADLYLRWRSAEGEQRIVFELKIRTSRENSQSKFETLKSDGLIQTAEYANICGADESHLIIFDRREGIAWSEKVYAEEHKNQNIKIWGM